MEEKTEKSVIYRFGEFELDAAARELRAHGERVTTQPKAFELLLFLLENRHRAVDKDELQTILWPKSIVTETALTRCVMKARRAVNDDADKQAVIRTVHGHGYRFIAELTESASAIQPAPEPTETEAGEQADAKSPIRKYAFAAIAVVAIAAAIVGWTLLTPSVPDSVRIAVLPIDDRTEDPDLEWSRIGLMSLMARLLESEGIEVVSERTVSRLAGVTPIADLMSEDGEFLEILRRTTGATHIISAQLDYDYPRTYTLSFAIKEGAGRPERRIAQAERPTELVRIASQTVAGLITKTINLPNRSRIISDDDFVNELYARGLDLEIRGDIKEARQFFELAWTQEPELYWPRYEYALCTRILREYDVAEPLLIELAEEARSQGLRYELLAANNGLALLHMARDDYDLALPLLEEVQSIATELEDREALSIAYTNLGLVSKNTGQEELAFEQLNEALEIWQGLGIDSPPGSITNNIAGILSNLGRFEEAEDYSNQAIENFRLVGNRRFESTALSRLSTIYYHQGKLDDAESSQNLALEIRRSQENRFGEAISLIGLSAIAAERGNLTQARQLGQQAYDIAIEVDHRALTADALSVVADAERRLRRSTDAIARYTAAEAIFREINDTSNEIDARVGNAETRIDMGDLAGALRIAVEIIEFATEAKNDNDRGRAQNLLGDIAVAEGKYNDAAAQYGEVLALAENLGDRKLERETVMRLADVNIRLEQAEPAASYVDRVVAARPERAETLRLQARLAFLQERTDAAESYMTQARMSASESWTDADEALLAQYQDAANNK